MTLNCKDSDDEIGIKISKKSTADHSFNDGIIIDFDTSKPKYLAFHFSSSETGKEDTNIRLYSDKVAIFCKPKSIDAVLNFRCGHNGLLRLNYEQVIDFYNETITPKEATKTGEVKWRKAEFGIDWEEMMITYCYDGETCSTMEFYDNGVKTVNGLMIYNLQPGTTSFLKNLTLLPEFPSTWKYGCILRNGFGLFFVLTIFISLT